MKQQSTPKQQAEYPDIVYLSKRELKRVADGLISLADQFYADKGVTTIYDNPIKELEGMIDEIISLVGELIPVINGAIERKEK